MAEKMASSSLFDEDDHHHHHHHHQQQQKQGGGGAGAPPPWLTVNLSDPARALEEDRQRWCTCSRNPSSCVIHASAAAQWLSPGVGSIENGSRVPLQRDSSETLTNMTGGGVPGGGGGGPRSGPPGQFLVDLQHSVDTAHSDLVEDEGGAGQIVWKGARMKADILGHPLYEQLLSAHVGCLRIATPVHHLPRIDAQLADAQHVVAKYSLLANGAFPVDAEQDKDELDQFMTHYVLLLCSFKEHLQQHVRVHAMEAVMACWELEQSLLALTGVAPEEGNGDTMSDDEDELDDEGAGFYDLGFDGHDNGGFGPLIPTETERSLMERVRQELKTELKQGYKERIVDVREEILRKRRAGKLPGDSTSVLKTWWDSHSKWPYPTEDEKARLVQETGLQLKQINNWFINQRKRNWHSNPSASLKNKRKRC